MRIALLTLLAWLVAAPSPLLAGDHPDLDYEVVVVRAFFEDRAMVAALGSEHDHMIVDYNKNVVFVEVTQSELAKLLANGWRVEVDQRRTEQLNRVHPRLPGQSRGIDGFPCYRTVAETYVDAAAIAAEVPQLASWIDIGDSWEKANALGGSDIRVLKLTNSAIAGPKPKLFGMSAVHAREYTTAELHTRFAEYLVDNYGTDADATWLLDYHEIHLVLQANPDGRVQAQTGLSWRKNTNTNYCSPTSSSRGADLNRNFPFAWGCCGGSSGSQCSLTYRGPAPGSEPETQAITDYVRGIFDDQRDDELDAAAPAGASGVFLDTHSYSELVLWPWGFTTTSAPNGDALQTFGRKLAWFNGYFPEQAIGLYPTDGTTDDFAYGELGLAAYTFELGTSFFQDCTVFESRILPDNMPALLYAAKVARSPYLTPAGPDTLAVTLSPAAVASGAPVALNAIADDSRFENSNGAEAVQNIAGAEYYIDVPPWGDTPVAIALSASDGSFDASSESVGTTVDTSGLSQGRHMVFVRSRDQAGNWGAVSARFLYIVDPATAPALTGTVTAADTGAALSATISAGDSFSTVSDASGNYELLLVSGTYDVTASPDLPDYAPARADSLTLSDGQRLTKNFELFPYCDVFTDDIESGSVGWTAQSPWTIVDTLSSSPSHSWTDSPGGDYEHGADNALSLPTLDFEAISSPVLEFSSLCRTEAGYDYCVVEISDGSGAWTEVARYDGVAAGWVRQSIELPALAGVASAQVRFRLESDFSVAEDGWYIDDVTLRGSGAVCLTGDIDGDGSIDSADNCRFIANPDQRDTNGDGFGNRCDPDLDNDGVVNFADLVAMKAMFFQSGDSDSDLDGDGSTNFGDLSIMKAFFFGAPGPGAP